MVIGHELTHGFDSVGRQFDKNGNRIPWWTNETIEAFDKQKICIIDQYSNYTVTQINLNVRLLFHCLFWKAEIWIFRWMGNKHREKISPITVVWNRLFSSVMRKFQATSINFIFKAYQKWAQRYGNREKRLPGLSKYSPEQMFFINFGQLWCEKTKDQYARNAIFTDLHSPAAFRLVAISTPLQSKFDLLLRTIGPTSNFVEFDRAFGCQPGQGNSRVNKCTVW